MTLRCTLALLVWGALFMEMPAASRAQTPVPDSVPFHDPDLPVVGRVADLVRRLTLEEKVSQLQSSAPPIPRLGIPAYNYRNEALHGLVGPGNSTVFPISIALGATWDAPLIQRMASVISDEARAKYRGMLEKGGSPESDLAGLSFFSPTVNLVRDPRWGRDQESYGEDPYLIARMGVAFVRGMQGDDQIYFKTVATAKHFAVHSGPDHIREKFEAQASPYDLTDTYLPHFEAMVREAHVGAVMAAYSGVNGTPMSANHLFLTHYLRERWGFDGFVVSDCGGVMLLKDGHHAAATLPEAAAMALKAGLDLDCGDAYGALVDAVHQGLVSEAQVDTAVERVFAARFKLGMFDPPARLPWADIHATDVETPAHRALALTAAREAIVLLKNASVGVAASAHPVLPIALAKGKRIVVVGPMATVKGKTLTGVYSGQSSLDVSLLEGISARAQQAGLVVSAVEGTDIEGNDTTAIAAAVDSAKHADLIVLMVGLAPGAEGRDHETTGLQRAQEMLAERIAATGKPVVVVLMTGFSATMPWVKNVAGVIEAWYPGEEGGSAVADVLFGKFDPAGRLPVTFYAKDGDLPPYESYDMRQAPGRTYRYFTGKPQFAFGYGLSYTTFRYAMLAVPTTIKAGDSTTVSVDVTNTGARAGEAVVEIYATKVSPVDPKPNGRPTRPIRALVGFARVPLAVGAHQRVKVVLQPAAFATVSEDGQRIVAPGTFVLAVGGQQPSAGNAYGSAAQGVIGRVVVTGAPVEIP